MQHLQSALGVIALIGFAFAISENRRAVNWRSVAIGLAVSIALAVLFLKVPPITALFGSVNGIIAPSDALDSSSADSRGISRDA